MTLYESHKYHSRIEGEHINCGYGESILRSLPVCILFSSCFALAGWYKEGAEEAINRVKGMAVLLIAVLLLTLTVGFIRGKWFKRYVAVDTGSGLHFMTVDCRPRYVAWTDIEYLSLTSIRRGKHSRLELTFNLTDGESIVTGRLPSYYERIILKKHPHIIPPQRSLFKNILITAISCVLFFILF